MIDYCWVNSPVGRLLIAQDSQGLREIRFADGEDTNHPPPAKQRHRSRFRDVISQIEAYFSGKRQRFSIKLAMSGTPFQLKVWRALQEIPYGTTVSYGHIARRIGNPRASRAVGAACGRNPISIITPCHRVIGSTGKLTGFGGGLTIKQKLLFLEKKNA